MGRSRKEENEGLPKGVYRAGDKYIARYWSVGSLVTVGTYDTPEEAEYRLLVAQQGNHWEGLEAGPYFGFTYIITNKKTGKRYVGKKQFYKWAGPVGGYKCTDIENEWWDEKAWFPNNWEFYTGSQVDLNREIEKGNIWDFRYEVLDMCRTRLDLHISELSKMLEEDVLEATDEKGEYLWYNKNIASLEFRPPFKKDEVKALKGEDEEKMRVYYLKPNHCIDCGSVLPYGVSTSCCKKEGRSELRFG